MSTGDYDACAIRESDGEAQCWGDNTYGQSTPRDGVALGIRENDGVEVCWGRQARNLWR